MKTKQTNQKKKDVLFTINEILKEFEYLKSEGE